MSVSLIDGHIDDDAPRMTNNETKGECRPDYEREYYRHIEIIKKLTDENETLQRTILGMCRHLFVEKE